MDRPIYLDANANAPVTPDVEAAVFAAFRSGAANPSSDHAMGERARSILEVARDSVSSLVAGAFEDGVVFTSGCTEANNQILGIASVMGATAIATFVEHASVLRPVEALRDRGLSMRLLTVDGHGVVDLESLEAWLSEIAGPVILTVQSANSETGVLQPMDRIASLVAGRPDVLFHSDAAQAFGKRPLELGRGRGPDVLSVSGHKLHAPMGVGALIVGTDEDRVVPFLYGGGQERGLRAGTQAVPLIAGFGAACESRSVAFAADVAHMARLRDRLEEGVSADCHSMRINGKGAARLPNTSNMCFPGIDGMALVANLDRSGLMCSQGSACNSMRPEPSPVLIAMGLSERDAYSSIRLSVSPMNSVAEIDFAIDAIARTVRALRSSA